MGKAFLYGNLSGGKKPMIIVTAPSGSAVTCSNGTVTKHAAEKDGTWTFRGCGTGMWWIRATKDGKTADGTVDITEDGQLMRYYIALDYQPYPDDFDFGEFGIKGTDYEVVVDDGNDTVIPVEDYRKYKNWKCRLLNSGNGPIVPLKDTEIDVFAVGGGAAGDHNGAGSGYTATQKKVKLTAGTKYDIVIGSGGQFENAEGGKTEAFGVAANGGEASTDRIRGGNGGSGGAGRGGGKGGQDGGDGTKGTEANAYGGIGQHSTTREFGEESGCLYATGGDSSGTKNADTNTGDGGPGGTPPPGGNAARGGKGGSGIVVFRASKKEDV